MSEMKRIEVNGRQVVVSAEDLELEELIQGGIEAQRLFELAKANLDGFKDRVREIAEQRKGDHRSLLLTGPRRLGFARVSFAHETEVDEAGAALLEKELPASLFGAFFNRRTIYKPVRGLSRFVQQPQTKDVERLKNRVMSLITFKPKSPQVKFFSDLQTDADAEDAE